MSEKMSMKFAKHNGRIPRRLNFRHRLLLHAKSFSIFGNILRYKPHPDESSGRTWREEIREAKPGCVKEIEKQSERAAFSLINCFVIICKLPGQIMFPDLPQYLRTMRMSSILPMLMCHAKECRNFLKKFVKNS